ncbi:MAG TPA: FAD-binding protein [Actinophytocola sp.]|uniref:FAD-binding protein n=1 Tax=Actinophytocola sp. TaxID=1872138 RepID=UPI002DDCFDD2|nr:FAD-binding protein [Actinophytocola sp.]HEV2779939.1 FAD-binding protein [Actinophytocola sp.]
MTTAESLRNWAGNITFGATRVHRPTSVDELRRIVAGSPRIRPLGTAHSFSRIADTTGELVAVTALPPTVDLDRERSTVTVAAGVRYGDVVVGLCDAGFSLPNLGSLPHISIGGACQTGTHGSGDRNGNLATAVSAIEMVTATGDLVVIRRGEDPDFPGTVVALGALGVVTRLTLDLGPTFDICQYVYENLPREQLAVHFDQIFGAGYSVCLFTDWRGPVINQVWLKRRADAPEDWTPDVPWLGATPAAGPLNPVPGMPAENCTEQLGVPGPWHDRLPHFRLGFTPSAGDELQSEFFVPRDRAVEALDAVYEIHDRIGPVVHTSEIRTIAADDLWMSPHYGRDSVAIHFTWIGDPARVAPVLEAVQDRLAPFEVRPHWGKLSTIPPEVLSGRYERLPDFRALARKYDATGKFRNDTLDAYLG